MEMMRSQSSFNLHDKYTLYRYTDYIRYNTDVGQQSASIKDNNSEHYIASYKYIQGNKISKYDVLLQIIIAYLAHLSKFEFGWKFFGF